MKNIPLQHPMHNQHHANHLITSITGQTFCLAQDGFGKRRSSWQACSSLQTVSMRVFQLFVFEEKNNTIDDKLFCAKTLNL